MSIDLSKLPAPEVIEPLDYEAILAQLQDDFAQRWPDYSREPHDPITKALEVAAYRELILRARINDAARANLLAFAVGGDLDQLGAFYGVERLEGEPDEDLRRRIQLRITGWGAGNTDYYRYHALSADPRVVDAWVDTPEPGCVRVAVLPQDGDESVVEVVRTALNRDEVRLISDRLDVVIARAVPVTVHARLYLRADAPDVIAAAELALREAFAQTAGLGWDVATSWLVAQLHVPGIKRVELIAPTDDISIDNDAYAVLADVRIEHGGIEW